jgi:glutamate formiminotransferase
MNKKDRKRLNDLILINVLFPADMTKENKTELIDLKKKSYESMKRKQH